MVRSLNCFTVCGRHVNRLWRQSIFVSLHFIWGIVKLVFNFFQQCTWELRAYITSWNVLQIVRNLKIFPLNARVLENSPSHGYRKVQRYPEQLKSRDNSRWDFEKSARPLCCCRLPAQITQSTETGNCGGVDYDLKKPYITAHHSILFHLISTVF